MKFSYKRLDELGSVSRGRSKHRPRNAPELYGGPYPFVQTADVKKAGLYLTEYSQTYSEKGLAQSKLWPKGTLCITIAANIADTAILGVDACFPDSVIGFISDDSKSNVKYVKYLFDYTLQTEFKKFSQGAAQDNLSQEKLLSIKLPVPDVEFQNRIVAILSDYDSAIDNARRQIALLEEAAMRLYREWFVVHADPKWEKKTFGAFAKVARGRVITKATAHRGEVPVVAAGLSPAYFTEKANVKAPSVTISASGANAGYVWYHANDIWASDCSYLSKNETPYVYFSYAFLKTHSAILKGLQKGSAQPHVHGSDIEGISFFVPGDDLVRQYEMIVNPVFQKIGVNEKLIASLTEARDRLLPKLMSGEVSV